MQNDLMRLYCFTRTEILEYLAGLGTALLNIDLPANDHAAEHVQKQIEIEILTANRGWQVSNIPAIQLVWRIGTERARFAARVGWPFAAPVCELLFFAQHPVESRFRGDIVLLVSQSRDDLARRQMTKFGRVRDCQQLSALLGA